MTTRRRALFLERRNYRRRRAMDAVRLLPVLGLVLWMIPMLWPGPGGPAGSLGVTLSGDQVSPVATSRALLYLFCVWAGLCAGGFVLWMFARPEDPAGGPAAGDAPGPGLDPAAPAPQPAPARGTGSDRAL